MSGHAEPVGIAAELSAAGRRLRGAMAFAAPLLVLFLAWPVLVAAFDVNPRVFPGEALHFEYSTSKGLPIPG